jgi:hypothetical protein
MQLLTDLPMCGFKNPYGLLAAFAGEAAGGQAFVMLGVMSDEIPDGISSRAVSLYGSRCEGVLLRPWFGLPLIRHAAT